MTVNQLQMSTKTMLFAAKVINPCWLSVLVFSFSFSWDFNYIVLPFMYIYPPNHEQISDGITCRKLTSNCTALNATQLGILRVINCSNVFWIIDGLNKIIFNSQMVPIKISEQMDWNWILNSSPLYSLPYSILGSSSKKQFTLIYPWLATQENRSFMRSRKRCVGGGTFYPAAQWTISPPSLLPFSKILNHTKSAILHSFLGCANPDCMCRK